MENSKVLLILICLALSGCSSAELVSRSKDKKGGGTIKYKSVGMEYAVKASQQDALAKMEKHCNGPYAVLSAHEKDEHIFMKFVCADR